MFSAVILDRSHVWNKGKFSDDMNLTLELCHLSPSPKKHEDKGMQLSQIYSKHLLIWLIWIPRIIEIPQENKNRDQCSMTPQLYVVPRFLFWKCYLWP